jgi:chromosome segregation ATPase
MPLSNKDFYLQPISEGQDGQGVTGAGGSVANDSTSPIHGFGENNSGEADYDGEYQAMVQRVGQKAREQEKRRPVDLAALAQRLRQGEEVDEHIVKHGSQYRLVSKHGNKNLGTYPTKAGAEKRERQVQYFKHMGEDSEPMSQASRELLRVARQSNPEALSNTDAIYGYLGSIAKKTQDNYKQVNNILRQLDPLSSELDSAEQEINKVNRINSNQQELLRRLNQRVNQVNTQTLPSQQRANKAPAAQAAATKNDNERGAIAKKLDQPSTVQPQAQQTPAQQQQPVDVQARKDIEAVSQHIKNLEQRLHAKDVAQSAKEQIIKDMHRAQNALSGMNSDKIAALAQSIRTPFSEDEVMESRLYAMKRAGYDIL